MPSFAPRKLASVLGLPGLLLVLGASGPCGGSAPEPEAPPAAPPASPAAKRAPDPVRVVNNNVNQPPAAAAGAQQSGYAGAMQLVDAIAALPQLTKPALEGVLGVPLTHDPTASADEQYYIARLPGGAFEHVEVRISNPQQEQFAMVILRVRAGEQLKLAAFNGAGRIGPSAVMTVNPRVPPSGILTYATGAGQQKVSYQFTADTELLTGVVIDRRASNAP